MGKEYFATMAKMLTSAFGLVAALSWNEAIKAIIDRYITKGNSMVSYIIYALVVTVIVVMVTIWLAHWTQKIDDDERK
ncbi:hypothetical protein COV39_03355 [Candidatus Berkelbacteria bacterium CG11_big_fil_rev_8_21_14_0_20_40_23]|nr:MAG: hypothetical protein COV39_03355 [Candidatus Berkelbacteria bacterium CG11_big_fil_rev_8_21_14_0_20_40_23]PIX30657.1 MAG: hypothetical protein COZ62_01455 [Candidatus Berkelbacteria bacterium CG_4_8_14_3_um_filter_39_27]